MELSTISEERGSGEGVEISISSAPPIRESVSPLSLTERIDSCIGCIGTTVTGAKVLSDVLLLGAGGLSLGAAQFSNSSSDKVVMTAVGGVMVVSGLFFAHSLYSQYHRHDAVKEQRTLVKTQKQQLAHFDTLLLEQKHKIAEREELNRTLALSLDEQKALVEAIRGELEQIKERNEQLNSKILQLDQQVEALQREATELKELKEKLKKQVSELSEENGSLKETRQKLEGETNRLKGQIETLSDQIEAIEKIKKELKSSADAANEQNQILRTTIDGILRTNKKMTQESLDQIVQFRGENDRLSENVDKLEKMLNEKREEIKTLKKEARDKGALFKVKK